MRYQFSFSSKRRSSFGFRLCWIFIVFCWIVIIGLESTSPIHVIGNGTLLLLLFSFPFLRQFQFSIPQNS